MNTQTTPQIYFTLGKHYDYQKYLEQRSHLDRVVLSIDDQTAAIVGSGKRLAERITGAAQVISGQIEASGAAIEGRLCEINTSICEVNRTLVEGFETVTIKLASIDESIFNLQEAMTAGLSSLLDESKRTNEILSQLIQKVETPDQVWAEEKFAAARSCVDRSLWQEAIEFATKAIDGDDRNSGYKLEPSFYFLRGRVFEGLVGTEPTLVDLRSAKQDFLSAHRYSGKGEAFFNKMALTRAGWCAYCLDELGEAEELLIRAFQINAVVPEAEFLLSKVRMRLGSIQQAKQPLFHAISQDSFFCFRAANDGDFIPHIAVVRGWFTSYKSIMVKDLEKWSQNDVQLDLLVRLSELTERDSTSNTKIESIRSALLTISQETYLTDLIDFKKNCPELLRNRNCYILNQKKQTENKIDLLSSIQPLTQIPNINVKHNPYAVLKATEKGAQLGGLLGAIVSIYVAAQEIAADPMWFFPLIFSPILIVPSIAVGAGVGWVTGFIFGTANDSARVKYEKTAQAAAKTNAQTELEREKRSISKSKISGSELSQELGILLNELGWSSQ